QQEWLPAFNLFWYDGGMKPPTPEELEIDGESLPLEGMMFVGDKGKILAEFRCENPKLIPKAKMSSYMGNRQLPKESEENRDNIWIEAFKNKTQSPGSFLYAG